MQFNYLTVYEARTKKTIAGKHIQTRTNANVKARKLQTRRNVAE